MTAEGWERIYDLRDDEEQIRQVQEASLRMPGFGFPPQPFLFGTSEWWSAIEDGSIECPEAVGRITAVYWGSMGDWPEFRIQDAQGVETTWTRDGDLTRYVEGLQARVQYALIEPKANAALPDLGPARVVLGIWLEPSDARTPLYKGYRGSQQPDPEALSRTHSFRPEDPAP